MSVTVIVSNFVTAVKSDVAPLSSAYNTRVSVPAPPVSVVPESIAATVAYTVKPTPAVLVTLSVLVHSSVSVPSVALKPFDKNTSTSPVYVAERVSRALESSDKSN